MSNKGNTPIGGTSKVLVHLQGKIAARSKAAILLSIVPEGQQYEAASQDLYDKVWFPLSQISKITEAFSLITGKMDMLVVTEWIAKQKGLR